MARNGANTSDDVPQNEPDTVVQPSPDDGK